MIKKQDIYTGSLKSIILILILATFMINPLQGLYEKISVYEYSAEDTIAELSLNLSIPASKLIEFFELPIETDRGLTLAELNISADDVEAARQKFRKTIWGFSWNIVLVGMLVIFSSLSLTGLLIGALSRAVIFSERPAKTAKSAKGKTEDREAKRIKVDDLKSRDSGYNAVIAAITALHFHLKEAEEISKMTLSWKREPISVWRTSGKLDMPNRVIRSLKD